MNARNLLIGIGIVAVVTGGVLGSGALTQVNAERSATIQTTGDNAAAIGLAPAENISSTYVSDSNGDDSYLQLSLSNLNDNATTTITAINVTNNLDSSVTLSVDSEANWVTAKNTGGTLSSGSSQSIHLEIDTTSSGKAGGGSAMINVTATTL